MLRRGRRDSGGREGQALVELAILLTLMTIVLVVALTFLGQSTSSSVGRVSEEFGKAAGDSALTSQPAGGGNPGRGKGAGNGGNPGKPPNPGPPPKL